MRAAHGAEVGVPDRHTSAKFDLAAPPVLELLRLHCKILDELRDRKVLRSSNGPAGDYAELLCAKAFDLTLQPNSSAGYDAIDADGFRYEIKCRRLTKRNGSRQLSALRNLSARPFDKLVGVLFAEDFAIRRAALIPIDVVLAEVRYMKHVNADRFILRDAVWSIPGVVDVTVSLTSAQAEL